MRFQLIFIVLFLVGCAAPPAIYNPKNISNEHLATITPYDHHWNSGDHSAYIISVFDESSERIVKAPRGGALTKVSLPKGKYEIVFKCNDGFTYSFPRAFVDLELGEQYTMFCEKIIKKNGRIKSNRARVEKTSIFSPDMVNNTRLDSN